MHTDKYKNFKRNENSYVRREVRRLAKVAKLKVAKEREELARQSH